MTPKALRTLSLFLFIAGCALLFAQTQQKPTAPGETPTFTTTTRLVIVDVVATTKTGAVITGLKPQDFQIFENGRPQKVKFFEEHTVVNNQPPRALPQMPPNQYTNYPVDPPKTAMNIMLFDLLNVAPADQLWARKEMLKALTKLPPGRQVALFVLGNRLRMIQGPSSDAATLVKAAQTIMGEPARSLRDASVQANETDALTSVAANAGAASMAIPGSTNLSGGSPYPVDEQLRVALLKEERFQTENRIRGTLGSLMSIARMVSGYPGRKNLVWVSAGIPFQIGPDMKADKYHRWREKAEFTPELEMAGSLLADAQITIYPVEIGGLSVQGVNSSVSGSSFSASGREYIGALQDQNQQQWNNRVAMDEIATQTGGRVFTGTNDLSTSINEAMEHGSRYYTIAYAPDQPKFDGTYRNIEIKGPATATLVYRRGYVASKEKSPTEKQAAQVLASAMQLGMPPSTALLTRVQVLPPDKDHPAVRIDYAVAFDDIRFSESDDHTRRATVDFMATAWDSQSRVVGSTTYSVNVAVKPNTPSSQLASGIPGHQELTLKPGKYLLCLGTMDRLTQNIGTIWVPVEVPTTK